MSTRQKYTLIALFFLTICSLFSQDDPKRCLQELLPEDRWYDVFYTEVLESKDRDTALNYLPSRKKNPRTYMGHLDAEQYWYEPDYWPGYALVMDEEGFGIFGHLFDIEELTLASTGNLFDIAIHVPENLQKRNDENDDYSYHNWDLTRSRSNFTFLFLFDGDFLDIFVDDFSKHLATFCRYNDETKQEILHLINNNTYDESKVTWPRRESKNHVVNSQCMVIETLRLRKDEDTSSETLRTMERGTFVRITALGKQQTIDGITANWVQVKLDDGTEGWCFGGYLVEVPEELDSAVSKQTEETGKTVTAGNDGKSGSAEDSGDMNNKAFPIIPVVCGGGVLVAAIIVVTILARRKKG